MPHLFNSGVYLRGLSKAMRVSDATLIVSTAEALEPRWRADGKELFVLQSNAYVYSPSADGQRFLVNAYPADAQSSLDVLINWPASLSK